MHETNQIKKSNICNLISPLLPIKEITILHKQTISDIDTQEPDLTSSYHMILLYQPDRQGGLVGLTSLLSIESQVFLTKYQSTAFYMISILYKDRLVLSIIHQTFLEKHVCIFLSRL